MNKKFLSQIGVYVNGILSRLLDENGRSIFSGIEVTFKSGTKYYPASAMLQENRLIWNYNGRKDKINIEEFTAVLLDAAEKYDEMDFKYTEGGRNLCVLASLKGVKYFTEETVKKADDLKSRANNSHIGNREYLIKTGEADELLKEIGIMAPNGKIKNDKIRKYNQIDHFVELIAEDIEELCKAKREITVLDCACGKSYLSFVLNYYIRFVLKRPCRFICVDHSDTVINASKKMAENLRYGNMEFIKADLEDFIPEKEIDICISLHACDTATDMALACALKNRAKMIVAVPCCHKELLEQYKIDGLEAVLKYGILKARISDAITDAMRGIFLEAMGYDVSVKEYISPLETPKNIMIKAMKKRDPDQNRLSEYWGLCNKLNISPSLAKFVLNK